MTLDTQCTPPSIGAQGLGTKVPPRIVTDEPQRFSVDVLARADLARCPRWQHAFASSRKDHRFYELVEDTILQGFDYRYFVIKGRGGAIRAIQPFFILDQDLLAGVGPRMRRAVRAVRRVWPRFLTLRTMMIGCAVGEGGLDGCEASHAANAEALASAIMRHAHELRTKLIVLKEFPARYRDPLSCFLRHGFTRVPSLPMTRLNIDFPDFDAYMARALNGATRRKLRKKFAAAAAAPPIEMRVVCDVTPFIDAIHPLYLQVYHRSKLHFEKLSRAFLCGLGCRMPDRTRFFIWRQNGRIVAFTLCMIEGNALFTEYIGLDYAVALDLHLYHYAVRDMITWAIAHGYKWLRSSGLNYDPKLHLRHVLDPTDLYVRHTSTVINAVLTRVLPWMEPTRYDPTLKKFPNYRELWAPP
jgi:hypothetical protein